MTPFLGGRDMCVGDRKILPKIYLDFRAYFEA